MKNLFLTVTTWVIAVSMVWAQPNCANNLLISGDAEQGQPTVSHQDIDLAVGFSRIWPSGSLADFYAATVAPAGYSPPSPATGNYVSCWIAMSSQLGFREGFMIQLSQPILPNTGVYALTFDLANLGRGWGSIVEMGIYGVDNPNNTVAPNPPISATVPDNLGLFGASHTVLIGTIPIYPGSWNNNKVLRNLLINTNMPNFPANGITHLMVTRSDQSPSGASYVAFDNFCLTSVGCVESDMVNHDAEQGTPTNSDQDIANAVGFDRLWRGNSWADFYGPTMGPISYPRPIPATGNYVSCWIVHGSRQSFREGFKVKLDQVLPPNTGTHSIRFDMACLNAAWGSEVHVGLYALHNPGGGDAPNTPTTSFLPTNVDLYGTTNTQLIGTVVQNSAGCNGNKQSYSLVIDTDAAGFPLGGMTHLMITRADGGPGGGMYMAFDNFCLDVETDVCAGNYAANGNAEAGTPSRAHQDIDNANGFRRIWQFGSVADYYAATQGPFTPPAPADGNYVSCWIANYNGGGTTYREGFQNELVAPVWANTGQYELSFEMACLGGWGQSEVAVYGVYNPNNNFGAQPTGAYTPSNIDLFGATNTVLLGTVPVSAANCSNNKQAYTINVNSDAVGFPANGITHYFVTHSDRSSGINGALYMGFDNFCWRGLNSGGRPTMRVLGLTCGPDVNGDYIPDYVLEVAVDNDFTTGTMQIGTFCGQLVNSHILLNGSGRYLLPLVAHPGCAQISIASYSIRNQQGTIISNSSWVVSFPYPVCADPCVCGEDFQVGVGQGYDHLVRCPNDVVTPRGLLGCDLVIWTLDGVTVDSTMGNDPLVMPHQIGNYELCMTVIRTDASGAVCTQRYCERRYSAISCQTRDGYRFSLQPNPADNLALLTWETEDIPDQLDIHLYSLEGRLVQQLPAVNGHDGQASIDVSVLPDGVYIVRAEGEGYQSTPLKLVVQH